MEMYKLPDKLFKIVIINNLNDLEENTVKQIKKFRKTIDELNDNINIQLEIIKRTT
jgi:predicted GTPase